MSFIIITAIIIITFTIILNKTVIVITISSNYNYCFNMDIISIAVIKNKKIVVANTVANISRYHCQYLKQHSIFFSN